MQPRPQSFSLPFSLKSTHAFKKVLDAHLQSAKNTLWYFAEYVKSRELTKMDGRVYSAP